ncbi:MAG: ATP-binding cassette domain-containing protein, partial [Paracoccaceae bacterium]
MLEVKNLSVAYGKHIALNDISLDVSVGEIVVILGANGAGKSTMLRSVAGICEGSVSGGFFLDGK